jgi:hypothetical protein
VAHVTAWAVYFLQDNALADFDECCSPEWGKGGYAARHYQAAAAHHQVGHYEKAAHHAQATAHASAAAKSHAEYYRVDRSSRGVLTRWWGLGLLSLAAVAPRWPLPFPENRALGGARSQRAKNAKGIPSWRRKGILRLHAPKRGDANRP